MDQKAKTILFNKYWSSTGWKLDYKVSDEDFEYAKSHGVMFDNISVDHQQVINWITKEFNISSKINIVKCFINSLSTRRLDLRSGLSSYAFARNFPKHDFVFSKYKFCSVCGSYNYQKTKEDINILNFERIKWGGVRLTDPLYVAWNLEIFNKQSVQEPTNEDINILKQMILIIKSCESSDRPTQLEKKLANVLKSSIQERRGIIDILGICGILETKEHKGFFDNYIPYVNRPVRPINKTDWEYPVDWWTGESGINETALNFYFGEYLK